MPIISAKLCGSHVSPSPTQFGRIVNRISFTRHVIRPPLHQRSPLFQRRVHAEAQEAGVLLLGVPSQVRRGGGDALVPQVMAAHVVQSGPLDCRADRPADLGLRPRKTTAYSGSMDVTIKSKAPTD